MQYALCIGPAGEADRPGERKGQVGIFRHVGLQVREGRGTCRKRVGEQGLCCRGTPGDKNLHDSDRIIGLLDAKTEKAEKGERIEKHLLLTRYKAPPLNHQAVR